VSGAFDDFLARAWADHADHAAAVARRLRTDTPEPGSAAQVAALARFVVHLVGEHLGRFDDARWRLDALAGHRLASSEEAASALRVARATIDLAEPRGRVSGGLAPSEAARAEAAAAAVCVGRGNSRRALALIASARQRIGALPNATAADHRPLAIACNNMAWALQERGASRTTADTAAMLEIAAASRVHWARAGTWLEVERADYALAITHLDAGRLDDALRFGAQCVASCITHDAPALEHFYGHEALARIQHERGDRAALQHHVQAARAAFDQLAADDRTACQGALDALDRLVAAA
jgi:hypothetical protein